MINIKMQSQTDQLKPRITVVGVGGAGGNAVNNMIASNLEGCEFLVCNTDAQALENNKAPHKIQLGVHVTRGLGAGANPEIGRAAAEESIDEIMSVLEGSNMVFVTAGMGGGTGTGAASVIAQMAREAGILTIGVITKPFHFEGTHRMKLAEAGITELQKHVDTLIVIPNQNLFRIANEKTTFSEAFCMADEVLQSGVRGVTDLMVMPGLINLDFADIRAVMAEMGKAMMGTGEAIGERRAVEAAEAAISNPLLDDISMKGARGVLINITGGLDMTLFEVDEAANRIRDEVDQDANIIFGSTFDETMDGKMRVSVVATGIDLEVAQQARPVTLTSHSVEPARRNVPTPNTNLKTTRIAPSYAATGGYNRETTSHQDFSTGTLPSSVIPSQAAAHTMQPTASAARPVTSRTQMPQTTAGGYTSSPAPTAPEMVAGHATTTSYAQPTAAARKMEELETEVEQTYMQQPAPTQRIERPTRTIKQSVSAQPKAERHGNSFIPPKPVDPSISTTELDLFDDKPVTAPIRTQPIVEKTVKKSPSLFERFTKQRHVEDDIEDVEDHKPSHGLSVEDGGKSDEDELDIPAFLRRQAN